MKNFSTKILYPVSLFFLVSCSSDICIDASMVLTNGNIYTVNPAQPKANTVFISDDKIIRVDESRKPFKLCKNSNVIDLDGASVYPGFSDAHGHLKGIGYRELTLNLQGYESLKDTMNATKNFVAKSDANEWIVGRGWIDKKWPEKRFPNIYDLDKFSPNNPLVLMRADGHALVANSIAIDIANITVDTPNPDGGFIEKDKDGQLTGLFVDNAMELINKYIPKNNKDDDKEAFKEGIKKYNSLGWTQIQIAGGSSQDIEILNELKNEDKLSLRIYMMVDDGYEADKLLETGPIIDPLNYLTVRTIKMYADGALGSRGAALKNKYNDYEGRGVIIFKESETKPRLEKALEKGIQIATHAIGDYGNQITLDWYEDTFKKLDIKDWPRWRIEHSQVIEPIDQDRFVQLNIIPSMQASHAIGDLHFAIDRLGMDRINHAYSWRDLIEKGLIIAGGTDAPVEIGDPRIEFYAAVTRKDLDGFYTDGWNLNQKLEREEALKMYTIWAAIASFEENKRGSIEVGKYADFTIFDKDIMQVPDNEILTSKNLMTIVGGKIVYQRNNLQ